MYRTTFVLVGLLVIAASLAQPYSCPIGASRCDDRSDSQETLQIPTPPRAKIPDGVSLSAGISEDDAVAIALWNNAALQADLATLGLARADLLDAGLLRNPTLQLLLPIGYTQFEMLLNLPGEVLWQRPRRVAVARIELDHVAKGLEQNGLNLVRDVRVAFADLALAQDRARLADEAVMLRREIAAIIEARLRAGDISELEANYAKVDLSAAEELAARSPHDVVLVQNRLRLLLGLEVDAEAFQIRPQTRAVAETGAALSTAAGRLEEMLGNAFAHRPDLRAAALAIEAAANRAKWERSRLFALAELLSIKRGGGLDFSPRPGVSAELPVFHRNKGGIARADAEVERASRQYLAVRQQVGADLRDSWALFRKANESLALFRTRTLAQTEEGLQLARKGYESGDESYLFVLESTRRWVDARVREAELVNELRRATAQFDRSLGRKHDSKP